MQGNISLRVLAIAMFATMANRTFAQTEVPAPQNVYARQSV